ncbi:MAG: LLM class F420-dependent oxidoreductase [Acidimicrobiia bacterium]
MTRLGYQIPNFTYPDTPPSGLFGAIARQAREAESAGFDTVLVMDHFLQIPPVGPIADEMVECYTLLAALARETSTVRLSALVTGNTYRNPAVLAKTVTALDIVSEGRAQLGIGAGWFEAEHTALGVEFGTFTDRFEKLEEALQIVLPLLRGETVTFTGARYRAEGAFNSPPPVGRIPVMIGGSGERKTLRMVARYADESNLISPRHELPRKLDVLAEHCAAEGRDRAEITVNVHRGVVVAPTHEEAVRDVRDHLARQGREVGGLSDDEVVALRAGTIVGDPDAVGEALSADLAQGVDGFTLNLTANGHVPGRISLLGEVAAKVLA